MKNLLEAVSDYLPFRTFNMLGQISNCLSVEYFYFTKWKIEGLQTSGIVSIYLCNLLEQEIVV